MLHVGDITKLNGAELPAVDIITGGSPCQDLSIAGKRAGLAGERSGLFMEQIRIIKEMRMADVKRQRGNETVNPCGIIPRFMVWENVPGAFSSSKGEDFRAVLEEICRIVDHTIPYLFLDLRPGGGNLLGPYWEMDSLSLGESWTLNTGESPRDVRESFLSQILEGHPPRKYYLSRKACRGILRRSAERGKVLPAKLKEALEIQAGIK